MWDVQQGLSRCLILFINLLQFKGIEPDPTAAALADIHGEAPDLDFGQLIETGWAFHDLHPCRKARTQAADLQPPCAGPEAAFKPAGFVA